MVSAYFLRFWKRPTVRALGLFCLLSGLWALLAALIYQVQDPATRVLLNRFKLLTAVALAPSILALAIGVQGPRRWHSYVWAVVLIIPVLSALVICSPYHEFMIGSYGELLLADQQLLTFHNGPWFPFHIANAQLTVALAVGIMVLSGRDVSRTHRLRIGMMSLAIVLPFLGDALAVHIAPVLRYLQIVPTLLFGSAVILVFALLRGIVLDVVPFARGQILDSTGDLYFILDAEERLVDVNRAALGFFPYLKKGLGKPLHELVQLYPDLRALLSGPTGTLSESQIQGEFYEIQKKVLRDSFQQSAGTVFEYKNITQRKAYELQLESLNEIKTRLLAVIGHDFQGNLGTSLMLAQNLERRSSSITGDDLRTSARHLQQIAKENIQLIEGLLTWSKHRLSDSTHHEMIQPKDPVTRAVEFMAVMAESKGIQVIVESDCEKPILSDGTVLTTIVRNLLSNALKFSPAGSQVRIRIQEGGEELHIMVMDEGPGIESERQARLFELHKDKKGIGLFLCREFAERLGGRMGLESKVGSGSRFIISLPLPR
jgi:signal transduction histidine kinase